MPRFVVLYHDCPPGHARPSHWDLMFEQGDILRTWALAKLPTDWHPIVEATRSLPVGCRDCAEINQVSAEQLADHRRHYLEYEGPISGGRGQISRVEEGTFEVRADLPDQWQVHVNGGHLLGTITLAREMPNANHWQLTYHADSSTA